MVAVAVEGGVGVGCERWKLTEACVMEGRDCWRGGNGAVTAAVVVVAAAVAAAACRVVGWCGARV